MKTFNFDKTLNSQQLKENVSKLFNVNVNLDKYSREQLEDIRNQLRTKVFQYETQSGFNELLTNEAYQKDKAILQLLNTRIKEMLGEDIKKLKDKLIALEEGKKSKKMTTFDKVQAARYKAGGMSPDEAKAKATSDKYKEESVDEAKACTCDHDKKKKHDKNCPVHGDKVEEGRKITGTRYGSQPDDPNNPNNPTKDNGGDDSGNDKTSDQPEKDKKFDASELTKALGGQPPKTTAKGRPGFGYASKEAEKAAKKADKKAAKKGKTSESQETFRKNVRIVNESLEQLLQEDEEAKAKIITAAGDMVNDFTSWMQRVGQFQTKSMIELADAIKSDFGPAESEAFKQALAPALAATLETLTQQREAISNAVAVLAGEATAPQAMGPEPTGTEEPMPAAKPDELNEPTADQLAASEPAATGREMRESKFSQRLAESHSIIAKLAK